MSTPSDLGLDLDLQLLPAWARQSPTDNRYSKYEGGGDDDRRGPRSDRFGGGGFRRDRPPRREGGPGGSGPRPGGPRRDDRGPRPGGRFDGRRPEPREPEIPLPDLDVYFLPEPRGVESIARQIKLTGRAYPLFDIARLVMQRPERYTIELRVKKNGEGQLLQPLLACSLDDSVWLTEEEAVQHLLRQHFSVFYQTDKIPTEPPKGTYTLVAVCGMSGTVLGPPNLHEYQVKLHKLHAERFSRLPFEVFKARVKIVRDEAIVKQWLDEQSFRTEFTALNLPEPLSLQTREEVEAHFRQVHVPNLVRPVDNCLLPVLPATAPKRGLSRELVLLLQRAVADEQRFPMKMATVLSQQFAGHGLQFFKVQKTVTHVCVARPHFLDLAVTSVSDGVKKIVEFINAHAGCTRKRLIETLAPTPPTAPAAPAAAVAEPAAAPETGTPPAPTAVAAEPTPEQRAIIGDLHWLIHQGHVIEFTDGRMETAKAPKPRPVAPAKPTPPAAAPAATPGPAAETPVAPTATTTPTEPAPVAAPEPVAPPPAEPAVTPVVPPANPTEPSTPPAA